MYRLHIATMSQNNFSESLYRLVYQLQLVAIHSWCFEWKVKVFYNRLVRCWRFLGLNEDYKQAEFKELIELRGGLEMHRNKSQVAVLTTICASFVYLFDLWRFVWGGKVEGLHYPCLSGLFGGTRLEDHG